MILVPQDDVERHCFVGAAGDRRPRCVLGDVDPEGFADIPRPSLRVPVHAAGRRKRPPAVPRFVGNISSVDAVLDSALGDSRYSHFRT